MPGGAGSYSQSQGNRSAGGDPSESGHPRQNPFGSGLGYDPAKPEVKKQVISNTRVELPPEAYRLNNPHIIPSSALPARPGYNIAGKAVSVRVNQYKVLKYPTQDVWQYAFMVGNGAEKRGLVKKAWESGTVQTQLRKVAPVWLWDGNALAWCSKQAPGDASITVDLDAEAGRQQRPDGKRNIVEVRIKCVKPVRMAAIQAYLSKKITFDESVLDAINFLDHLMREYPASQYTVQKRSYFNRAGGRTSLDNVVEAMKGVYSSIRLCDPSGGLGLGVNVDVANGTFWVSQFMHQAARNLCHQRNKNLEYSKFRDLLLPTRAADGKIVKSEDFQTLERMKKLKFTVKHRGKLDNPVIYSVKRFTFSNNPKFYSTGLNAKTQTFPDITANGQPISVFDYFLKKYNITLIFWQFPLVETERAGYFPMELCTILPNQKYPFKLSPDQTTAMIKFAVTRPPQRIQSINAGINMLKWSEDPNLKHFDAQIDTNMTVTQAKLLNPPEVHFAGLPANAAKPGTSGRWDLRGKKFLYKNTEPLANWGIVIVNACVKEDVARHFMGILIQTYVQHGGEVKNKQPVVVTQPQGMNHGELVAYARKKIMEGCGGRPQIILFVMPNRDNFLYERLKKSMECRFACVSQMVNTAHVQKAQQQYCSNVCMKINAKLGGTTARCVDPKDKKPYFARPTMIIGADVSHPTPGSPQASMAAITVSFDQNAIRYCAAVETNGARLEMITRANWKSMLIPLVKRWCIKLTGDKACPQHIYYFRDGVSEGQYQQVLDQEVRDIKECLVEEFGPRFGPAVSQIKFTVTICAKRHHVRFFPKEGDTVAGDRNGNALPGTLVERDVTHPFEYDFYLSSHSAIQGTARPVHYHVLLDEAHVPVDEFQRLIYHHCYQYMRSTTPVSLFPAVYYAHLASNRARAHEDAAASVGPRGGQKYTEAMGAKQRDELERRSKGLPLVQPTASSISQMSTEIKPLIPMGTLTPPNATHIPDEDKITFQEMVNIRTSMWYI